MTQYKKILGVLILFTLFLSLYCQEEKGTSPSYLLSLSSKSGEENNFQQILETSRVPENVLTPNEEFQQMLETTRAEVNTKSISAALILSDGSELIGVANKDENENAVTSDMHFSIGSCTKTFIAAYIFRMIEENKLSLDDTLQKLLYDTGILNGIYKTGIDPNVRIRDLLDHRSGFYDFCDSASYDSAIYGDKSFVWDLYKTLSYVIPSINDPYYTYDAVNPENNATHYSSTNYILLGKIIENITGEKISQIFNQNFLDPLNMKNTYMAGVEPYFSLTSIPGPAAKGFEYIGNSWITSISLIGDGTAVYSSAWVSGNMVATARELAHWMKFYYNYQQVNGYTANEILNSFDPGDIDTTIFPEVKYGYGIEYIKHVSNCELWGHTGTIPGFRALMFYIPAKDISIAVLMNVHQALRWDILNSIINYINAKWPDISQ